MATNKASNANKTKRVLKDIDFSQEDSHIALCHRSQGVANQSDFVVALKSNSFSEETIQKLQRVKVELAIPDFIQAFFKIEEEKDAKALAYLMGWTEDLSQEAMETQMDFENWVASNMESFEIVKALKEAEVKDYPEILSKLDEWQYLTLLQEQQQFEQGLREQKSNPAASATEFDASTSTVQHEVNKGKGVNPVVKQKAKKETLMAKENESSVANTTATGTVNAASMANAEITVVEKQVEMIEKSQFEAIQKQFQEQQEQLQKALATVEKFEQERLAQIEKQRLADLEAAVKNKDHAAVLHKALKQAEQAEFTDVVKALAAISLQAEQSDLFVEKSAQVEEKSAEEDHLTRLLKSKFQTK